MDDEFPLAFRPALIEEIAPLQIRGGEFPALPLGKGRRRFRRRQGKAGQGPDGEIAPPPSIRQGFARRARLSGLHTFILSYLHDPPGKLDDRRRKGQVGSPGLHLAGAALDDK